VSPASPSEVGNQHAIPHHARETSGLPLRCAQRETARTLRRREDGGTACEARGTIYTAAEQIGKIGGPGASSDGEHQRAHKENLYGSSKSTFAAGVFGPAPIPTLRLSLVDCEI
jgi:hypothetical protein